MPSGLNKVQKRITKKRTHKHGKSNSLTALHENSRDAQRIRRAAARDEKVSKSEVSRARRNATFLNRMAFLHAHLSVLTSSSSSSLSLVPAQISSLITTYISRHENELESLKATRREGRAKSTRQTQLEDETAMEREEFRTGFWTLDLRDEENVKRFLDWDGRWASLGPFTFIRVHERSEGKDAEMGGVDGDEEGDVGITVGKFPPAGSE